MNNSSILNSILNYIHVINNFNISPHITTHIIEWKMILNKVITLTNDN